MTKVLLILGVSGVGKSTVIKELQKIDSRFVYIMPYTTRPVREGEKDKISVSHAMMDALARRGDLLTINELYGVRYGTPIKPIDDALAGNKFPLLDWPISKLKIMHRKFGKSLYTVYIAPPGLDTIKERLANDRRDVDGSRLRSAASELQAYWSGLYAARCDLEVISEEDRALEIAQAVFSRYQVACEKGRIDHGR